MSSDDEPSASSMSERRSRLEQAFGSDVSDPEPDESPVKTAKKTKRPTVASSDDGTPKKAVRRKDKEDSSASEDDEPAKKKQQKRVLEKKVAKRGKQPDDRPLAKLAAVKRANESRKPVGGDSDTDSDGDDIPPPKLAGKKAAAETKEKPKKRKQPVSSSDEEKAKGKKKVVRKKAKRGSSSSDDEEAPEASKKDSDEDEEEDAPAMKEEEKKRNDGGEKKKESDGETSDTSIEDRYDKPTKVSPKKKKRKSDAKEEKPKSKESKDKTDEKTGDPHAVRLARLKKMVIAAGLRFNYKKMFEELDGDKQRVRRLESELKAKGIEGPFTLEACKAFKLRREEETELAELSKNAIIDIGAGEKTRVTRSQRAAATTSRRPRVVEVSSSGSESEEVENKTAGMFANLQGIVSDGDDSSD